MRRLALPKLMQIDPCDDRRMGACARHLMAAAWHRAYGSVTRRRLTFPKKA
jgi:hypothetical protein